MDGRGAYLLASAVAFFVAILPFGAADSYKDFKYARNQLQKDNESSTN